jgi:hypothetical protein
MGDICIPIKNYIWWQNENRFVTNQPKKSGVLLFEWSRRRLL